jgi:hypothetical protein
MKRSFLIRILITGILIFSFVSNGICAWDPTKPTNNAKLQTEIAQPIRDNWDAIATGTDPALQVTNAKVSPTAGIVDTKLAQIVTANKVSAAALCNFSSAPVGAGVWPLANLPGINDFLPSQTGNTGKSLITNGSASSWGFPTGLNITSQAQGDILFYNGSAWVRFAPGTSGNVLKTLGAGQTPTWTDTSPKAADLAITSQAAGDILYFDGTNWVRLAKDVGKFLRSDTNGVNWQTVANTSNLLFSFGNNTTTPIHSIEGTVYYITKINTKIMKIVGVSTVTISMYVEGLSYNGWTSKVRVTIGSATPYVYSGTSFAGWVSGTIDISGLTNNTLYDLTVELECGNLSAYCKLYEIEGFGS